MQEDEIGSQELLTPGATNTYLNWKKDKVKDYVRVRPSVLVIKIKIDIIYFYFNDKVVAGTMYEFDLVLDHAEESAAE